MNAWLVRAVCIFFLMIGAAMEATSQAPPADGTALTLSPAKLDFGSVPVESSAAAQTVTVSNPGQVPITINQLLTSGIDFSQTNTCGAELAAGASCAVQVTFKPAITGPRLGTLNIFASLPGGQHILSLTGIGE